MYAAEQHNRDNEERRQQIQRSVHSHGGKCSTGGNTGNSLDHQALCYFTALYWQQEVQEDADEEELNGFEGTDPVTNHGVQEEFPANAANGKCKQEGDTRKKCEQDAPRRDQVFLHRLKTCG